MTHTSQKQRALLLAILAAAQMNYSCAQKSKKTQEPTSQAASTNTAGDYNAIAQDVKGAFKAYLTEASAKEENKGLIEAAKKASAKSDAELTTTLSSNDLDTLGEEVAVDQMISKDEAAPKTASLTGGSLLILAGIGMTGYGYKMWRSDFFGQTEQDYEASRRIIKLGTRAQKNIQIVNDYQKLFFDENNKLRSRESFAQELSADEDIEGRIKERILNVYDELIPSTFQAGEVFDSSKLKPTFGENELADAIQTFPKKLLLRENDAGQMVLRTMDEIKQNSLFYFYAKQQDPIIAGTVYEPNKVYYDGKAGITPEDLDIFTEASPTADDPNRRFFLSFDAAVDNKFPQIKAYGLKPGMTEAQIHSQMTAKRPIIDAALREQKAKFTKAPTNKKVGSLVTIGILTAITGAGGVIYGATSAKDGSKSKTSASDSQKLQLTSTETPESRLMKKLDQLEAALWKKRMRDGKF